MKVLLILVDGMRPDSLAGIPEADALAAESAYTDAARTVFPSVTLPCHMSLFHSVDPGRHGITTNLYTPQVRPVSGLFEQLQAAGKRSAMFYNWEELRDVSRPGSMTYSHFLRGGTLGWNATNHVLTDAAIDCIAQNAPDFTFLYLGWADEAGHAYGWMSPEYLDAVRSSWADIDRIRKTLPPDFVTIVTADHGGHDRAHGTEMPEDMTIPLFLNGAPFEKGKRLDHAGIKDIAPTVAKLLGIVPAPEWEGESLL